MSRVPIDTSPFGLNTSSLYQFTKTLIFKFNRLLSPYATISLLLTGTGETNRVNQSLGQLMQKEMSRKEFLLTLSLAVISILGISRIIEALSGHSLHQNLSDHSSQLGYNNGDYGAKSEPTTQKLG